MKRISSLFLLIPLLLTSCKTNPSKMTFQSGPIKYETYYKDSYFEMDNRSYHHEIAVASFASTMAGYDLGKDYKTHGKNITNLWKQEGFKNIYMNDAVKLKPTTDSVGLFIASKKIKDFNLVTMTIRSYTYEAEWANNFTVGATGHSKGFYDSSVYALEQLENYITNNHITGKTKIWLNGYSRGGAITNLAAAQILQKINENTFFSGLETTVYDLYAYCIEPPAGACTTYEDARSDLYSCIHSVFNFNDLVPMILDKGWGFVHYGQVHYFPDRITDIYFNSTERKKLVSNYHFMRQAHDLPEYKIDEWKFYDAGAEGTAEKNLPRETIYPSQGLFAKRFSHEVFNGAITREAYTAFEEAIRNLFATVYGYNPDIKELSLRGTLLLDAILSYPLIQTMVSELRDKDYGGFAYDVEYLFYMIFDGKTDAIKALYNDLWYFLLFLGPSLVSREDLLLQLLSRDNLINLVLPHYTDLNYSFLLSCDSRLYGKAACKMNDGTYRVLEIKTPDSVTIYESHLKKNVFTYSNGKMASDTLSAEKLSDGSIRVYLPKNGSYQYTISAPSATLYNVNEYGEETVIDNTLVAQGSIE